MRKRYLTLNCDQEETMYRLRLQMSPYTMSGWVENTQFKVYKHLKGIFAGKSMRKLLFCFYGTFQQSGKHTQLVYQVRPGAFVYWLYALLGFLVLGTLFQFIFRYDAIDAFIFSLLFALIYFGVVQFQKKLCISNFEAELTTEKSRKNRRHL